MRFTILIAIALLCVVLGIAFLKLSAPPRDTAATETAAQPVDVATESVLVARTEIPIGTVITPEMIDHQPWPKNLVLEGFITGDPVESGLVGSIARTSFSAREPFIEAKLAKPNEGGFLASSLQAGMRAVTVAVDSISGVAGFIMPGDRVDILLTHSIPQKLSDNRTNFTAERNPTTSEILLENIRVLALNDRKEEPPPSTDPAQQNVAAPPPQPPGPPTNVTLELSPADAEKLRLAEKNGAISLALRPTQEEGVSSEATLTRLSDISKAPVVGKAQTEDIVIIRGIQPSAQQFPVDDASLSAGMR